VGSKIATRELSYDEARNLAEQLLKKGVESAGAACARCFPAGTLVATAHGLQPIQTLHVGQRVLAENPKTGKVEAEPIETVIADPVSALMAVHLSDGSAITVTADHPFWVDGGPGMHGPRWLPAGQLRRGD
jgi:Pretoxin HINT domain